MVKGALGRSLRTAALCCATVLAPVAARADLLIENVTLIDGTGAAPLPGASILVKGDRISLISPSAIQHGGGVEVINGKGKYLIPGMMDTHIHLQRGVIRGANVPNDMTLTTEALHGYLYSGVTSLMNYGGTEFIFPLRDEERAGKIVSPRIFSSGQSLAVHGGYGDGPGSILIDDWAKAKPEMEAHYKKWKPDIQKVLIDRHGVFTPLDKVPTIENLRDALQVSNEHGVRTTVHAASEEDYELSLAAGIDAFAHVIRYPASDRLIARLATKQIPMSTTAVVFEYIARIADDTTFLDEPLFKATVNQEILGLQKADERTRYINSKMSAQYQSMRAMVPTNAKRLYDAGAILATGTDRTWGPTLHMEFALMQKAGIPPAAIVKMATLNGALYIGRQKDLGSIERGKLADMVLLTADPTKDVKNLQAIEAVIKDGKRIDLKKLNVPANKQTMAK